MAAAAGRSKLKLPIRLTLMTLVKPGQAMRALLAQHLLGADDTGAVDQPMNTAESTDSVDRRLCGLLVTDIGDRETGAVTRLACLAFDGLGVEVDQHDLGSCLDQHLRSGGTAARKPRRWR